MAGVALSSLPAAAWDALERDDDPFTSYAYLSALEDTGQVGADTRWDPCHVVCQDDSGTLLGALPLYLKNDSWGEFVFDFAWANAYEQSLGPYYPKLVTAIPYTPVGGRRLLLAKNADAAAVTKALIDAAVAHMAQIGASSWHVQFCHADELDALRDAGLLIRKDCQFHWFNRGYRDFDDYLTTFRSARRKKTRRERRRVREAGVTFTTVHGSAMTQAMWDEFYAFYASSFVVRGRAPYFSSPLFAALGERLGDRVMIKTAHQDGAAIAAALFLRNEQRLYGRYWGCTGFVDALHFETCYYQGIEYCLEHGLQQFDPGTQGEHKIARGFQAHASHSAHVFREPRFHSAVADYLRRELDSVSGYMQAVDEHLPFRADDAP